MSSYSHVSRQIVGTTSLRQNWRWGGVAERREGRGRVRDNEGKKCIIALSWAIVLSHPYKKRLGVGGEIAHYHWITSIHKRDVTVVSRSEGKNAGFSGRPPTPRVYNRSIPRSGLPRAPKVCEYRKRNLQLAGKHRNLDRMRSASARRSRRVP